MSHIFMPSDVLSCLVFAILQLIASYELPPQLLCQQRWVTQQLQNHPIMETNEFNSLSAVTSPFWHFLSVLLFLFSWISFSLSQQLFCFSASLRLISLYLRLGRFNLIGLYWHEIHNKMWSSQQQSVEWNKPNTNSKSTSEADLLMRFS